MNISACSCHPIEVADAVFNAFIRGASLVRANRAIGRVNVALAWHALAARRAWMWHDDIEDSAALTYDPRWVRLMERAREARWRRIRDRFPFTCYATVKFRPGIALRMTCRDYEPWMDARVRDGVSQ